MMKEMANMYMFKIKIITTHALPFFSDMICIPVVTKQYVLAAYWLAALTSSDYALLLCLFLWCFDVMSYVLYIAESIR